MNILMVHPHDIYSNSEPWTVRIVYIAKEFIKYGHNVRLVYFPLDWNGQKPSEVSDGITAIPLSRRHGPRVLTANILRLYKLAGWADVIHLQKCFHHAAVPALMAALLRSKPLHYDWDDWEVKIYELSTQPSILRNFIKLFLNTLESIIPKVADSVSTVSRRLKVECERLGVDKQKIFDAHVGADIDRFNPCISGKPIREKFNITNPIVLYLGQLHGGQYAEIFIETAAKIIQEYRKDLSFMIVGDGYRAQELKKISRGMNLDGKIIFAGAVSHALVPEYIAAADVCVACFEENEATLCKSPLKIVEYMASGKAIVATRVGEVPQMLGEAGILTPTEDINAMAAGIVELLENESLRKSKEILARKRAEEEYNWAVTAKNILKAYKQIAHK